MPFLPPNQQRQSTEGTAAYTQVNSPGDSAEPEVESDVYDCLQCFDAVGWAAGRASGL